MESIRPHSDDLDTTSAYPLLLTIRLTFADSRIGLREKGHSTHRKDRHVGAGGFQMTHCLHAIAGSAARRIQAVRERHNNVHYEKALGRPTPSIRPGSNRISSG
jgi:hypothetical protein